MKIICVGRNYAQHATELNNALPSEPVIFLKPDTALLKNNQPFFHPDFSSNIHHEVELVVKISKHGRHIQPKFAKNYYNQIALGIDFTARDLQQKQKEKGLPWEIAKAFDNSAVIGQFFELNELDNNLNELPFKLEKNGELVQEGNSKNMLFSIDDIIAYISKFFFLKQGDLIYTGTPAGVGQVKIGDKLTGYIENKQAFSFVVK